MAGPPLQALQAVGLAPPNGLPLSPAVPVRREEVGPVRSRTRGFSRPLPRALHPLVRRDGALRRATWDEALDVVARRCGEIRQRYGGDACCCFSCSKASNELNFLAQKFVRTVLGTNNIDSCNRT